MPCYLFFTPFIPSLCSCNFYNSWDGLKVSSGNRSINIRSTSFAKVKDWVSAINNAGLYPPESWSHPHRFGSFAPPRGFIEDGSQAQWFIDGKAAFEAIASAIENAKSEVYCLTCYISN
jgi:phospholipase D1/2